MDHTYLGNYYLQYIGCMDMLQNVWLLLLIFDLVFIFSRKWISSLITQHSRFKQYNTTFFLQIYTQILLTKSIKTELSTKQVSEEVVLASAAI